MPLVTLTVRKPKSNMFKTTVLDAVHAALVSSGVPAADKFQRVIELDGDDFRFDPSYPDLRSDRDVDFALIEILWSVGRSVKVKKKLLERADGYAVGRRPESRECDGLFQGDFVGELVIRRRPSSPHVSQSAAAAT